jgi:hypothetical protein
VLEYPDITPSVADVAALLRARTKDVNGDEIGTFNDDTRPTSAQVITLIDEAVVDIQARMGATPPSWWDSSADTTPSGAAPKSSQGPSACCSINTGGCDVGELSGAQALRPYCSERTSATTHALFSLGSDSR